MNHALRRTMTADEFLAWAAKQELRWEFDGFQPVATTGDTGAHALPQINLTTALREWAARQTLPNLTALT